MIKHKTQCRVKKTKTNRRVAKENSGRGKVKTIAKRIT